MYQPTRRPDCLNNTSIRGSAWMMRAAAGVLLVLGTSGLARADSVTVTTLADVSDGDTSSIAALQATPGTDGEISLREAVTASNNTTGPNAIDFDAALSGGTIVLTGGALEPTVSVTISGPGADELTISGDHSSQIIGSSPALLPGVVVVDITIEDLRLTGGWSDYFGGALFFFGSSNGDDSLTLRRLVVDDNWASPAGAAASAADATVTVEDCVFIGSANQASFSTVYLQDCNTTISNTTIDAGIDEVSVYGRVDGGSADSGAALLRILHSTLVNDTYANVVLQDSMDATQTLQYQSSIFTGNGNFNMDNDDGDSVVYESLGSNVLDDSSGDPSPPPSDQLNTDPLLGPLEPSHGTFIFPLATDSPALDVADPTACAAAPVSVADQRGVARPQGAGCDVGAAELIPPLYVDVDAAPGGDGSSWAMAMQHLQNALAAATAGSQIWVAEGLYLPDVGTGQVDDDPTSSFTLAIGVELYGGFDGSETLVATRDIAAHTTILSGDLQGDDINTDGNFVAEHWNDIQGTNAAHVVQAVDTAAGTILDGVTVTAGDVCDDGGGAGIKCSGWGGPILRNLIVSGHRVTCGGNGGGAAGCRDAVVSGSRFSGCTSVGGGGWSGGGTFVDSDFEGNNSSQGGAIRGTDVSMTRCKVTANTASRGGGLAVERVTLDSVLLSGNNAFDEWGGGVLVTGVGASSLTNVTISGNDAGNGDDAGGGIHYSGTGTLEVANSIIWDNRDMTGTNTLSSGLYDANLGSVTVSNSILSGSGGSTGWVGGTIVDGGGNLDEDPLFMIPVDPATAPTDAGDLHLRPGSPALDAGDDLAVTTATDLDGNDRIQDLAVDLGAYEGAAVVVADLSVSVSDGVTAAIPGEGVTYTLVVHNDGPDRVATVGVSDPFPAGLSCSWTSVATGGATGNTDDSGDIAEAIDLPNGGTVTYTVSCAIDPAATGTLVNTATVTADVVDATPGDQSATDDDTVLAPSADLSVTAGSSCWAHAGEPILVEIRVDSSGPSTAVGATVATTLSADLLACTWSCVPSGGASCTSTPPSGDLSDTVDLPPSSWLDYTATCLVDPGSTSDQLTTVITVTPPTSGADDPVMTNNTVIEQTPGPSAIFADCFESGGVDGWSTSTS